MSSAAAIAWRLRATVGAAVLLAACTDPRAAASPPRRPRAAATPWLKGQLHLHSNRSGDSNTPPGDVVQWYAQRGYDFMVFTDHNHVTVVPSPGRTLVIPGVELTQNMERCEPPPERGDSCLLHVNALFVSAAHAGPVTLGSEGPRRADVYGASVARALAMGGIAQVNHPNYQHGADANVLLEVARRGALLVEVANEAIDSGNEGDARHPSTEALWDAVLTRGGRVFATATDDAHHYDDAERVRARREVAFVGDRGWVQVHARRDVASIRDAIVRGRFYASNGVTLSRVEVVSGALQIEVAAGAPEHRFRFVGAGGRVLSEVRGRRASHRVVAPYVRAVIDAPDGRRAWTQPAWP